MLLHNLTILFSTPVDWNVQSGAIWLAGFAVLVALGLAVLTVETERARDR